jgi:hypothetical protein
MPRDNISSGGVKAFPVAKGRIQIPIKGINYARSSHEIADDEATEVVNWWLSQYGRFETRPGTSVMTIVPFSESGTIRVVNEEDVTQTKVRLSTSGNDILPIRAVEWYAPSELFVVFAGNYCYTVPKESRWGLVEGVTWGSWETIEEKNVRRAGTTSYYMDDAGDWWVLSDEEPHTLIAVSDPSTIPCSKVQPGGGAMFVGELTSPSLTSDITAALFYGKLYIASGGNLQRFYVVSSSDLSGEPHDPEDRTEGDQYLETVSARALSNPAPDAAGALAVRVGRLWVGERDGSKVWFSGADDARDWGWNGTGTDPGLNGGSFNIDTKDGGTVSGICNFKTQLIVFKGGSRNTIHKILGTMSGDMGDPFRREPVAEGVSCRSPRCVAQSGDDVLFAGDGGVYSLQMVDAVGNMGTVPQSLKVNPRLNDDIPKQVVFNARTWMSFMVMNSGDVYIIHRGVEGWYRMVLGGSIKASCALSMNGEVYFGTRSGLVLRFDEHASRDATQSDGANGYEFSKVFRTKTFSLGGDTARAYVEKLMLALEVRRSGTVYLDVRCDYGSKYLRTIKFERAALEPRGWDDLESAWDSDGTGWDQAGISMIQAKVSKATDNIQFQITTDSSVSMLDMLVYAAGLGDRRWDWQRR